MTNTNPDNDKDWMRQAEQNLWDLANGATGMVEKLDKDGCIHELNYRLPPSLDANKFILKNRSNGRWADKVEVSSTQVTVNLTASYNEVAQLAEQQKQIERQKIIEVIEVVDGDSESND